MAETPRHGDNVADTESVLRTVFVYINPLSTGLFGDFYAYGTDLIFCYMD